MDRTSLLALALVGSACTSMTDAAETEALGHTAGALRTLDANEIVGAVGVGGVFGPVPYTSNPLYRAVKVHVEAPTTLDVWVRPYGAGNARAWLLRADFDTLAESDAASAETTSAHVTQAVPAGDYYVAFRDKFQDAGTFQVFVNAPSGPGTTTGGAFEGLPPQLPISLLSIRTGGHGVGKIVRAAGRTFVQWGSALAEVSTSGHFSQTTNSQASYTKRIEGDLTLEDHALSVHLDEVTDWYDTTAAGGGALYRTNHDEYFAEVDVTTGAATSCDRTGKTITLTGQQDSGFAPPIGGPKTATRTVTLIRCFGQIFATVDADNHLIDHARLEVDPALAPRVVYRTRPSRAIPHGAESASLTLEQGLLEYRYDQSWNSDWHHVQVQGFDL